MPSSPPMTSSTPVPDQGIQGTLACCATIVEEILSPSERMAEPGGPMKTIFFGDAAKDSGSLGFSEACPLQAPVLALAVPAAQATADANTHQPAHTAWTFTRSAMSPINSTLA